METFNRRDLDAAVTPGHPDFKMRPPHELVEAGFFEPCYCGLAGFREYVSAWAEVFGFRVEPVELIDVGDRIVLLVEIPLRARASGVPITQEYAFVATLENGKVAPPAGVPPPRRSPRSRRAGGVGDGARERGDRAALL